MVFADLVSEIAYVSEASSVLILDILTFHCTALIRRCVSMILNSC
jgi:hypothetical protein